MITKSNIKKRVRKRAYSKNGGRRATTHANVGNSDRLSVLPSDHRRQDHKKISTMRKNGRRVTLTDLQDDDFSINLLCQTDKSDVPSICLAENWCLFGFGVNE